MDENTKIIPTKAEFTPSVDNAIKNLTDQPTATLGTAIADLFYLITRKVHIISEKAKIKDSHEIEQYSKLLNSSIDAIPPEKYIEPSMRITGQALENSIYCISEKELRDMFVSLISNSMNKDYLNDIHPSFSEIIKQMSVLDAKIISLFHENMPGLPVCQYNIMIPGIPSPTTIPEHIFLELPNEDIFCVSVSLTSLSRFGLISISYSQYLHEPTYYQKFYEHVSYKSLKDSWPGEIKIQKGVVSLTPLGKSFFRVCIPH